MHKLRKNQLVYILLCVIATILEIILFQGLDFSHPFDLYIFPLIYFKMQIGDGILLLIIWMIPRIMMWLLGYDLYSKMFNDIYIYLITRGQSIKQIMYLLINKYIMFITYLFLFRALLIFVFTNYINVVMIIVYLLLTTLSSLILLNVAFIFHISNVGNRSFTYMLIVIMIGILLVKNVISYDSLVNIIHVHFSLLIVVTLCLMFWITTVLLCHLLKKQEL